MRVIKPFSRSDWQKASGSHLEAIENTVQPQGVGNPTLTPCHRRGVAGERGLVDTFWFDLNSRMGARPIFPYLWVCGCETHTRVYVEVPPVGLAFGGTSVNQETSESPSAGAKPRVFVVQTPGKPGYTTIEYGHRYFFRSRSCADCGVRRRFSGIMICPAEKANLMLRGSRP